MTNNWPHLENERQRRRHAARRFEKQSFERQQRQKLWIAGVCFVVAVGIAVVWAL